MPASGSGATTPANLKAYVRKSLLSGTAIILPVLLSLFVLMFAVNFLSGLLDPFVLPLQQALGIDEGQPETILRVLTVLTLVVIVFGVGAFAQSAYGSGRLERGIDATMQHIPGIGSVYDSLSQLSEMLLTEDTQSFREVKLVEYPGEGSYSVAFVTADTPEFVVETTGDEGRMVTLFMPMGPNPVMGGFIIHVEEDRVYDVNLTVEEGISSVMSFGATIDAEEHDAAQQALDNVNVGDTS